jgi:hypothetical protein
VSDIFEERRKGLEEEYFRRKDKESLQRLRDAIKEEAQKHGDEPVTMNCPRCKGKLHAQVYDAVNVDRCDTCGGVWLDAGELEQIVGAENTTGRWFHALWPGRTNE